MWLRPAPAAAANTERFPIAVWMYLCAAVAIVRILAGINDHCDPLVKQGRRGERGGLATPARLGVTRALRLRGVDAKTRIRSRPRTSLMTSTVSPSMTRGTVAVAGAASTGAAHAEAGGSATAATIVDTVTEGVLMQPFSWPRRNPPARILTGWRHGPTSSAINASTRAALGGSSGLPASAVSTSSAECPPTAAASPALKFARRRAA